VTGFQVTFNDVSEKGHPNKLKHNITSLDKVSTAILNNSAPNNQDKWIDHFGTLNATFSDLTRSIDNGVRVDSNEAFTIVELTLSSLNGLFNEKIWANLTNSSLDYGEDIFRMVKQVSMLLNTKVIEYDYAPPLDYKNIVLQRAVFKLDQEVKFEFQNDQMYIELPLDMYTLPDQVTQKGELTATAVLMRFLPKYLAADPLTVISQILSLTLDDTKISLENTTLKFK